ncbi:hypothetical protein [Parasegetibacter sp. NRK P23]|uniref:hypothetical protein n=1 Tax=Parasegetibacter sp. NRK P23 TaxID=2942999 RepID=UPI0020438B95|nr:hypothetical protein [Parasegetibacter sp. NRK P23]MCM5529916.1 hypothetical protein [Parasegetibacter sp. NRK P23]
MNLKNFTTFCFAVLLMGLSTRAQDNPVGAWKTEVNNATAVLIITPGYFSQTHFDLPGKKFIASYGGTWKVTDNGEVEAMIEFNTLEKNQVGEKLTISGDMHDGKLVTAKGSDKLEWTRVDDGAGPLSGDWRISGREQDGKINTINPGARKTVKILSGTRFQWIAINTQTGEFFGTGGGTYTFENGKYTENIEFFSRDSSRVGATLTFNGKVEGNNWDHSGLSSKGEPIHEIWTRQ